MARISLSSFLKRGGQALSMGPGPLKLLGGAMQVGAGFAPQPGKSLSSLVGAGLGARPRRRRRRRGMWVSKGRLYMGFSQADVKAAMRRRYTMRGKRRVG